MGDFLRPPSSLHQRVPDFKPNAFCFPSHLVVPKPQHLDALLRQKAIPLFVTRTLIGKSVPATIGFDREMGSNTEKVQEINAAGILAAELELLKTAVAKQKPEAFLVVGRFAS